MPVFFFVAGYFAPPSLRRQGAWGFLKGKLRRLGVPWLVAILVIVPLTRYAALMKAGSTVVRQPFLHYWVGYLKGVGTFQVGLWTSDRMNQMHFWFLSLLLTFFVVSGLLYALRGRVASRPDAFPTRRTASAISILRALLLSAILASIGYFIVSLMVPDMSWVTADLLWQFQPGGLVLYVACFLLGTLAFSRGWFEGYAFPGRLTVWAPVGLALAAGFLFVGHDVFARTSTSNLLPPALLLNFSFLRTFLCLSVLVVFIACAQKYGKRPMRLNQKLSTNSYNIYLVHIFFVTFFQDVLVIWRGGPPMAKTVVIFFAVLPISYGISRLIDRFPRGVITVFVALFLLVVVLAR
jgi:glucans biosynthesis protein C